MGGGVGLVKHRQRFFFHDLVQKWKSSGGTVPELTAYRALLNQLTRMKRCRCEDVFGLCTL